MSKKPRADQPPRATVAVNEVPASSCPKCGSTRRSNYYGITRNPIPGIYEDGSHDEAVYRRCSCLDCDQHRADRTVERVDKDQLPTA